MPYINPEARKELDSGFRGPVSAGELSYSITKDVIRWAGPKPTYVALATVVGVLVLTTFEFIWRIVRPFEERKIKEHGDVY